jgi:hypothetical protein
VIRAASCKNEFLLHNLVVSAHAQLLFYIREIWLILWLWKQILVKLVSHAKCLNSFWGLICIRASISLSFSSVRTVLFDCFCMWHTEPVARHFFTWYSGNWQARIFTTHLTNTSSLSLFPCKSFTLFIRELHFSINVDCLSTPLTDPDY